MPPLRRVGFSASQDHTEPHGLKALRAAAALRYSRRTPSSSLDPVLSLRAPSRPRTHTGEERHHDLHRHRHRRTG